MVLAKPPFGSPPRRLRGVRGCCSGPACGEFFTERVAQRDARAYRRKGLTGPAARIRDVLRRRGLEGSTVLEVGGGVGALHLELLKAGAATATNVELSPAYEPYAAGLAREEGLEARVQRRLLDFAREAEGLAPADLVVLNKVVCCYPDYESLVGAAADRTRRLLVSSEHARTHLPRTESTARPPPEERTGQNLTRALAQKRLESKPETVFLQKTPREARGRIESEAGATTRWRPSSCPQSPS